MSELAENLSPESAKDTPLQFEQPLTERMRTFLRIEFLFEQALAHSRESTAHATRAAVDSLLEIVTILGRGDVRTDILKELERQSDMLDRYRQTPEVDTRTLDNLIKRLSGLRKQLTEVGPKFVAPLKHSSFLTTIKNRSAIPGGTCAFDLPDYNYWLHQPHAERQATINSWVEQLKPVCVGINEFLWLARETNPPADTVAAGGLYQQSLSRNEQCTLVRILMPAGTGLYPEVSAGQHRFTVRFVRWQGVDNHAQPTTEDVPFQLAIS